MQAENLRTVKQIAEEIPVVTEPAVRWHIHRAAENGLAPAIYRRGRRVYIDLAAYARWLRGEDLGDRVSQAAG